MFQSTPDLVNRENVFASQRLLLIRVFQSTPDLVNRENLISSASALRASVSIHSRFS